MVNTRELALDVLMEILEKGAYSHLAIRDVLDKYNYMEQREKAFVKRVVEGTLERLIQIDHILDQYSKVPVLRMKPLIRDLLRMSVYQLLFMDRAASYGVINEAVKLAGKRGFRGLSGFVNGVLRNIDRNKEKLPLPDEAEDEEGYLSVKYSMPKWLVGSWARGYGKERTRQILEGLLAEHPLTVRFRESLGKAEQDEWLFALKEKGVLAQAHPYLPYAYQLRHVTGVKELPGFAEGWFAVQDVASMLVAEVAVPGSEEERPTAGCPDSLDGKISDGPLVVDVCAAPGGKALHMAEKLKGHGKVLARDVSENKVSQIRDNIERMGYGNIQAQVWDAVVMDEGLVGKADIVLADLPCSGLGVRGRKHEIKYRVSERSLEEVESLQRRILDVAWQYVKPGGVLIYSTCTMNPEENERMVEWFLERYPFALESLAPLLPEGLKGEGEGGMLQLFPGVHETDGFFLARLCRARP